MPNALLAMFLCAVGCHGGNAFDANDRGVGDVVRTGGSEGGGSGGAGGVGGVVADAALDGVVDSHGGVDGGGEGGDATVTVSGSCFGVCLETVLAGCPQMGQSCTDQVTGNQTASCYENGVKTLSALTADGGVTMTTVKGANGDVCHSLVLDYPSEDIMAADGTLIAHVDFGTGTTFTLTCHDASGATTVTSRDIQSPACLSYLQTRACTAGICVF